MSNEQTEALRSAAQEALNAFAELGEGAWTEEKRAAYSALAEALATPSPAPSDTLDGVTQSDRDFAANWMIIDTENNRRVRNGEWDHHHAVQAAMNHRTRRLP